MDVKVSKDRISCNYLEDVECYEVEIIENDRPCDTTFRIELIDNDYLDITVQELRVLKELLNSTEFEQFIKSRGFRV